jgi:hypothetical protein
MSTMKNPWWKRWLKEGDQAKEENSFVEKTEPNLDGTEKLIPGPRRASPLEGLGGGPTKRENGTLAHWEAQGLGQRQGQQFALDIQEIPAIGQFARVLPAWSRANNCEVRLTIEARPDWNGGATVDLTFDRKDLSVSMGQDLLARLELTGSLMALTQTIEHMKAIGADATHIDLLVEEANHLANSLRDDN